MSLSQQIFLFDVDIFRISSDVCNAVNVQVLAGTEVITFVFIVELKYFILFNLYHLSRISQCFYDLHGWLYKSAFFYLRDKC